MSFAHVGRDEIVLLNVISPGTPVPKAKDNPKLGTLTNCSATWPLRNWTPLPPTVEDLQALVMVLKADKVVNDDVGE